MKKSRDASLGIFYTVKKDCQKKKEDSYMQILKDRIRRDGKIKAGNAVSYTHLDVYKRQLLYG